MLEYLYRSANLYGIQLTKCSVGGCIWYSHCSLPLVPTVLRSRCF